MRRSSFAIVVLMCLAGSAVATPPDFSKWSVATLSKQGVANARVIQTSYPFSFTYCLQGSRELLQYTEMSMETIALLSQGRTVEPVAPGDKVQVVERGGEVCERRL